jgi:hypothetical protein
MYALWRRLVRWFNLVAEGLEIPMGIHELEPFNEDRDWWLLDNTSQAAHEPIAALRLLRRGIRGQALVKATGIKPTALQRALRVAMDEEGAAFARGVPIHDQGTK